MYREGSVYAAPGEDGVRCLVMRRWPRGISHASVDVWLKELGPLPDLLRTLSSGAIHWGEFALSYQHQLETWPPTLEALEQLRALEAGNGMVTLLCHEPSFPCHRFVLLDYLAGKL